MKLPAAAAAEILNYSTEAIVVANSGGDIVYVNQRAEELFGYEADEMLGEKIEILMPDSFRDRHVSQRLEYLDSPNRTVIAGICLQGQRKNGQSFDAEISLTPIRTDDGLLVSSVIRDVSIPDSSEAYFRNVLESAPDAIIIIDHYGKIAVVNGESERMFGYSRREMIGEEIEMLLPERMQDRHIGHRAAFAKQPMLRPMGTGLDLTGLRKDGSEFPVEISLSPVTSAGGAFVSSVIRDVTDRKNMEKELIEARHAAERANKANTAFLAAASHDLRQPVQALSLLNGALRRTAKDPLALEMIESQQHSLDAMTNLLNSLLDISRLDAGAVEPEFEEFPIQRLIDRLSAEFGRQARQKDLEFSACECPEIVRSDPNLLGEIIQNFVSNSIRYTDRGQVRLDCRRVNGNLCIDVVDTGIGIEAEQIDKVFQEFHQIKKPGADKEGFGLGLAIVKRLADLLEHEIEVQSDPGRGSNFSVCLPVVPTSHTHHHESAASTAAAGEATGLIILIEDDVKVANAWGLLLEAEGYRVATAESAEGARALVNHLDTAPELIISDFYLLDGSTGVEAVHEIREKFAVSIPAFIVSGDTSKVVQDMRHLENSIMMSKPVDIDHLLSVANVAIASGHVPDD